MLRAGKLVAFPTETVYGLGANALDGDAVARIFIAKDRPSWDPLIVHVADPEMARGLMIDVNEQFERLQREFWPGPLTLLVLKSDRIPDIVTAGRRTVGLRMPAHPVAHQLIRAAGIPIAAPSANLFSRPSPTTAAHVMHDLEGRIDAVIDSGRTTIGVESTVLDITQSPPVLYRPGGVTREQLEAVIGPVVVYTHKEETALELAALPSPGIGMRHYAPNAKLILVDGGLKELAAAARAQQNDPKSVGILLPTDWKVPELANFTTFPWGRWQDWDQLAERLFLALRFLDERGIQVILAPLPEETGLGAALRDRLTKAAKS
jgi:L-threonylcarbamoyladenylate synthase